MKILFPVRSRLEGDDLRGERRANDTLLATRSHVRMDVAKDSRRQPLMASSKRHNARTP
jgi:hypothetical protein